MTPLESQQLLLAFWVAKFHGMRPSNAVDDGLQLPSGCSSSAAHLPISGAYLILTERIPIQPLLEPSVYQFTRSGIGS